MKQPVILSATDFSHSAEAAVRRAAVLARSRGARLHVVHAVNFSPMTELWLNLAADEAMSPEQLRESAAGWLDRMAQDIAKRYGVVPTTEVLSGKPAKAIAECARTLGADLVVIGAHGEHLLLDLFVGSTATKLLRLSAVPVLLVRQAATVEYEHVVVASDFSLAAQAAANLAASWFPTAAFDLFHAYEAPYERQMYYAGSDDETIDRYRRLGEAEARRRMETFAAKLQSPERFVRKIRHGYAPALINQHLVATGAELLVVGSHRQSELEAGLLGSVAAHMVTEARVDLLLVPSMEVSAA